MLKFKVIDTLRPNNELLTIIKDFNYKIIKGNIKTLLGTNLQFISPTEYIIKSPISITILEYKVDEISNRPFFIKKHNKKYNLSEIKDFLKKIQK